mmetsp:Transcript_6925/g.14430  ORF Transcript_6925/g.14430 Transcript_6925/m.14430 type:complete len:133 (+) Transcript_6925:237-635(+)
MVDLYPILKEKVKDLANALVNIPKSHVWVHEKALYNIIGIQRSNTHGKCEVLTFLLQGIQKGFYGNKKKDHIKLGYAVPGVCNESEENEFNIGYQPYGQKEGFATGHLEGKEKRSRPRWFRKGTPLTDVKTQ